MQDGDKSSHWAVSVRQSISAPREDVWEVISEPGNLEASHPFCKKNPVHKWGGANSRDEIHYLSGWMYERRFSEWYDGLGYDLETWRGDKHIASVSWRIVEVDDANSILEITVRPHVFRDWPAIARWFVYWLRIKPYLRSYVRSVLMGFEWYITRKERVPRDAFGKHPWFSRQ